VGVFQFNPEKIESYEANFDGKKSMRYSGRPKLRQWFLIVRKWDSAVIDGFFSEDFHM